MFTRHEFLSKRQAEGSSSGEEESLTMKVEKEKGVLGSRGMALEGRGQSMPDLVTAPGDRREKGLSI